MSQQPTSKDNRRIEQAILQAAKKATNPAVAEWLVRMTEAHAEEEEKENGQQK